MLPRLGVYAGAFQLLDDGVPPRGTRLPAVINIGMRPTFDDGQGLLAEAHVLDFDGDLYGRRVDLSFAHRLRDEERFPSVEALREQIARDVASARRRLGLA